MVSLVREFVEKDPTTANQVLEDQKNLVHDLLPALEKTEHDKIIEIIKRGEANLEKLGVVSDYAKGIIKEIESSGGAAKICGAGGKTKSTGIILIYHTDLRKLNEALGSRKIDLMKVVLGAEGVRKEE